MLIKTLLNKIEHYKSFVYRSVYLGTAKVEVRQLLNGYWRIYAQDQLIAKHSPTSLKEPLRALPRNKHHAKGMKDYNWVYLASAPSREGNPYPFLIEHR